MTTDPVVGLAWRPVWSDLLSRRWLVGLFMSGLAALGVYLFWAIRQLTSPSAEGSSAAASGKQPGSKVCQGAAEGSSPTVSTTFPPGEHPDISLPEPIY